LHVGVGLQRVGQVGIGVEIAAEQAAERRHHQPEPGPQQRPQRARRMSEIQAGQAPRGFQDAGWGTPFVPDFLNIPAQ
jgi:hypothetical protein